MESSAMYNDSMESSKMETCKVDFIEEYKSKKIEAPPRLSNVKSLARKDDAKRAYFNEIIHVHLLDRNGNKNEDKVTWKVQRFRLTPDFLHEIIHRRHSSLTGGGEKNPKVSYLKSSDGEIILPSQMQRLCKPHPLSYYVILAQTIRVRDVMDRNDSNINDNDNNGSSSKDHRHNSNSGKNYRGDLKFVVRDVPQYSQNGIYEVKAEHVRLWIINGILDEDHVMSRHRKKMEDQKMSLKKLAMELKQIPLAPVMGRNGHIIRGKKADAQREERAMELTKQQDVLLAEMDESMAQMESIRKEKLQKLEVGVTLDRRDDESGINTWAVKFSGVHRDYYERLVIDKEDWSSVSMHAKRVDSSSLSPSSSQSKSLKKDDVDTSQRSFYCRSSAEFVVVGEENMEDYLVDISGISMERVEDGYGSFHRTNSSSSSSKNHSAESLVCTPRKETFQNNESYVDFYHGTYKDGKKSGHGVIYTASGIYSGPVKDNVPCGHGIMMYKDGDVVRGTFGEDKKKKKKNTSKPRYYDSILGPNPYARGLANGQNCSVAFSDGAFYEGEMEDGKFTGTGVYISADGDRMEGLFQEGTLQSGKITKRSGEVMEGKFRGGRLHGEGTHVLPGNPKTKYVGHFRWGEKHGRGVETYTVATRKKRVDGNDDKEERRRQYNSAKSSNTADDITTTNIYTGFFLNGKRNGYGRMEFWDVDAKSGDRIRYQWDGAWLAGNPRCGGKVTVTTTRAATTSTSASTSAPKLVPKWLSVPTVRGASSRYPWLYRLNDREDKNRDKLWKREVEGRDRSRRFRMAVEGRKRMIFESHRRILLEKLSKFECKDIDIGRLADDGSVDEKDKLEHNDDDDDDKFEHDEKRKGRGRHKYPEPILPSKSRHYAFRKMNFAPKTLSDAEKHPGLRTSVGAPGKERTVFGREVRDATEAEWKSLGLTAKHTAMAELVHDEYDAVQEKWCVIDVDQIRDYVSSYCEDGKK